MAWNRYRCCRTALYHMRIVSYRVERLWSISDCKAPILASHRTDRFVVTTKCASAKNVSISMKWERTTWWWTVRTIATAMVSVIMPAIVIAKGALHRRHAMCPARVAQSTVVLHRIHRVCSYRNKTFSIIIKQYIIPFNRWPWIRTRTVRLLPRRGAIYLDITVPDVLLATESCIDHAPRAHRVCRTSQTKAQQT